MASQAAPSAKRRSFSDDAGRVADGEQEGGAVGEVERLHAKLGGDAFGDVHFAEEAGVDAESRGTAHGGAANVAMALICQAGVSLA